MLNVCQAERTDHMFNSRLVFGKVIEKYELVTIEEIIANSTSLQSTQQNHNWSEDLIRSEDLTEK